MSLTFGDIKSEVAARSRLSLSQDAQKTLVERWVNQAIEDIQGRYDWNWLLDRQIVQTVIDKTAGTVSVSASGTTVTGSGTAFASADIGKFIQFSTPDTDDWYKITAVASTTSLTVEAGYVGTSALSAGTYTIRKFFYSIPDAEKILNVKQAATPRAVKMVHYRDFDIWRPFTETTGDARLYFVFGIDSSGDVVFTAYPWADSAINLEMRYKKKTTALTTDTQEPDIPGKWRHVIVDGSMVRAIEYLAIGNSDFKQSMLSTKRRDFERGIVNMLKDAEPESDFHPQVRSSETLNRLPGPHLPYTLSIPQD